MSKVSVAIFGINGFLGKPVVEALKSSVFADKLKYPILASTRDASKQTSDEHVKYFQGDYINGKDALVKDLKGVDVIIELLGPDPELFSSVEAIVSEVKPKIFIPTQFGTDLGAASSIFPGFLDIKANHSANIRKSGVKVVDIYNGYFAQGPWLYEIVGHVGADPETKTVTYFGNPNQKFAYSSLDDVGRVVASVATKSPSELPDQLRVQSGEVTPAEVVKRYEDTHNVKFEVKEVPKEEVFEEAKKVWAKGFDPSKFLYYLQVLAAAGLDNGVLFSKNDDELVNPGESLWKWSKY